VVVDTGGGGEIEVGVDGPEIDFTRIVDLWFEVYQGPPAGIAAWKALMLDRGAPYPSDPPRTGDSELTTNIAAPRPRATRAARIRTFRTKWAACDR
jgi:hypothetical protein